MALLNSRLHCTYNKNRSACQLAIHEAQAFVRETMLPV
jgi:hypothetical protein